jgi:hypothetical protein
VEKRIFRINKKMNVENPIQQQNNVHCKLVYQIVKNQIIIPPSTEEENKNKLKEMLINILFIEIIYCYYLDYNILIFLLRCFQFVRYFLK